VKNGGVALRYKGMSGAESTIWVVPRQKAVPYPDCSSAPFFIYKSIKNGIFSPLGGNLYYEMDGS